MTTLLIKLIFLINLIIFNYIEATPITTEDVVNERDLKSYLEIIKSRADLTKDPCNDFSKYACGNMDSNTKVPTTTKLTTFIRNDPQNESERKVRDLHLSCIKVFSETEKDNLKRIKYILEQVPDIKFYSKEEEVTTKNIAQMFLKFHLLSVREEPLYIEMYFSQLNIIAMPTYDESKVEKILTAANFKDGIEDIKTFTKKLYEFLNTRPKDEDADYDYIKINLESIDELKKLVPSNHINWDEIYNGFKDEFGTIKTKITVGNIELLKQLTEFIDATDKHTFINYLTLRYIETIYGIDCNELDYFYRYAVLSRLWNENFSDETAVNRFVTFVNDFEVLFKESQKTIKYENINSVYEKLNSKRNVAKNYKTILPDKLRDDFYKNYNIDVNYFYKNALQVFKGFVKDVTKYDYNKAEVQNSVEYGLKTGLFDETIKSGFTNMPYIQLFSTIGVDLWKDTLSYNKLNYLTDFELSKECSNIPKTSFTDDIRFMREFTSQKLAYLSLLHDTDSSNSKLHSEKELIESKHLDKDLKYLKKLYFIGLAQYRCESGDTELSDYVFKVLQNSMEFSEHFKCPANSQMNKTFSCQIENCKDDIKKYSILLPMNPGECYQNIF